MTTQCNVSYPFLLIRSHPLNSWRRKMSNGEQHRDAVICPKNLVKMWCEYLHDYHLVGEVHAVSNVINELPNLRRFRLVIIDESHNLRNREGKRYKVIKDYIEKNESKCVLLSATPYNKTYLDLSAQLRLFLSDEQSKDLGIRPEKLLNELGDSTFTGLYQCPVRS